MIEGWPDLKHFGKAALLPYMPSRSSVPHWTYPAPPGWLSVLDKPLPDICAWSWQQHVQAVMEFRRRHTAGSLVRYEDLVGRPLEVIEKLARELDLVVTDRIREYLEDPPLSRTTVSPPRHDKWLTARGEEIARVVPSIRSTAADLGYEV
jgi:hypothetical protein